MTVIWPAALPQRVNRNGYSRTYGDGRRFTPSDAGPLRVRRRFSLAAQPVSASVTLTDAQLARFEAFWNGDTRGGSLPFWFPDQVRGGIPLTTVSGTPLRTAAGELLVTSAWWLVLFGQTPPQDSNVGANQWLVQFQLSVLP